MHHCCKLLATPLLQMCAGLYVYFRPSTAEFVTMQPDWSFCAGGFQRQTKEFRLRHWGVNVYFADWAHSTVAGKIIPSVISNRVHMHAGLGGILEIIGLSLAPVGVSHLRHHITVGVRSPDELWLTVTWNYALSGRPKTESTFSPLEASTQCALWNIYT